MDVDDDWIGVLFSFVGSKEMTSLFGLGVWNWLANPVMRWFGPSWEGNNVVAECFDGWDSSCSMLMI